MTSRVLFLIVSPLFTLPAFFVFGRRIMNMEAHMFAVTESAASNLTAYLTQNRITSPIQMALMQNS